MSLATQDTPHAEAKRERLNFSLFWLGDSIGQFGYTTGLALFPLVAATYYAASAGQLGLLAAAGSAAYLLLSLPVGVMVDRLPKRRILLAANLARALALVFSFLLVGALHTGLTPLYVAALATGCFSVPFDIAYQSYVPSLVGPEHYTSANARLQASQQVAQVSGPTLAGQLATAFTGASALLGNAAMYALSAIFISRVRDIRTLPPPRRGKVLHELAVGLRFVFREPKLRVITLSTSLWNISAASAGPAVILLLTRDNALSVGQAGLMLSSGGLGGLIGALAAKRLLSRLGEDMAITVPLLATAPFAFLMPWVHGTYWLFIFAIANFLLWAGASAYNVAQVSLRVRLCPTDLLGRMNASIRFCVSGTLPVGAALGGVLCSAHGVRLTLLVCALMRVVAGTPLLVHALCGHRRMRSPTIGTGT